MSADAVLAARAQFGDRDSVLALALGVLAAARRTRALLAELAPPVAVASGEAGAPDQKVLALLGALSVTAQLESLLTRDAPPVCSVAPLPARALGSLLR